MARAFDARFVEEVVARVASLPENALPRWGRMTRADLVGHLLAALEFTLGEFEADIPFQAGPWTRKLLKLLILGLNVPMRRHVVFKDERGGALPLLKREGTLEDLRRALDRTKETDLRPSGPHPYFGALTSDEWKRLHVKHIAHHLRQFGVPL